MRNIEDWLLEHGEQYLMREVGHWILLEVPLMDDASRNHVAQVTVTPCTEIFSKIVTPAEAATVARLNLNMIMSSNIFLSNISSPSSHILHTSISDYSEPRFFLMEHSEK